MKEKCVRRCLNIKSDSADVTCDGRQIRWCTAVHSSVGRYGNLEQDALLTAKPVDADERVSVDNDLLLQSVPNLQQTMCKFVSTVHTADFMNCV